MLNFCYLNICYNITLNHIVQYNKYNNNIISNNTIETDFKLEQDEIALQFYKNGNQFVIISHSHATVYSSSDGSIKQFDLDIKDKYYFNISNLAIFDSQSGGIQVIGLQKEKYAYYQLQNTKELKFLVKNYDKMVFHKNYIYMKNSQLYYLLVFNDLNKTYYLKQQAGEQGYICKQIELIEQEQKILEQFNSLQIDSIYQDFIDIQQHIVETQTSNQQQNQQSNKNCKQSNLLEEQIQQCKTQLKQVEQKHNQLQSNTIQDNLIQQQIYQKSNKNLKIVCKLELLLLFASGISFFVLNLVLLLQQPVRQSYTYK